MDGSGLPKVRFSIVCPIKNETSLMARTLPSFYNVEPSEVILCFDNPPNKDAYQLAMKISQKYSHIPTRFLFVDKNPEYKSQLPWVRRFGFRNAVNERILTVDIDLIINKNVLRAITLVGKDNIGLVSCSKKYPYKGLFKTVYRRTFDKIINFAYPTRFTGLYALWKPYWLDSEDESVKRLDDMKQTLISSDIQTGEDTYLRNCIVKKHKVIYVKNVGATCLTYNSSDLPQVQWQDGRYFASQGYTLFRILLKAILYFRIYVLLGWMYEKGYHR
jgi:hypothetical protein